MDNKKICKYCKSEIEKGAKICPNCNKKQSHLTRNIIIAVVVVIVLLAMASGNNNNNTTPVSNNNSNEGVNNVNNNVEQEKFTVTEHSTTNDGYWTYVVGTVKNNTNKNYSYVQIEISLYDAEGNLIGSALDNINNFEPNGTWKFKAMATEDFSTYKIKDVTGW